MQILTDKAKVGALPGIVLCWAANGVARVPVACAGCTDRPSKASKHQQSVSSWVGFKAFGLKLRCWRQLRVWEAVPLTCQAIIGPG